MASIAAVTAVVVAISVTFTKSVQSVVIIITIIIVRIVIVVVIVAIPSSYRLFLRVRGNVGVSPLHHGPDSLCLSWAVHCVDSSVSN